MHISRRSNSFSSIYLLLILVCFANIATAQKIVTGIIKDKKNMPIAGARILVVDTDSDAKTENDGKYSIIVPEGYSVLKIVKNGYQELETVINSDTINVIMSTSELGNLSINELMMLNLSIASKKAESSFDSPLSSSVITQQDIIKSGVTSIPEALRLIPGFIIREQTNGVYDAHIRGFDYSINSVLSYASNTITLVMIDGRPVFRDFQGGTFWEALPIGLSDIERIEVIRGASSSMYGANAVAGAINIITTRFQKEETNKEYVHADVQKGNFGTSIFSINTGIKKKKVSIGFSANTQQRNRFETNYFDVHRNTFVPLDSLLNRFGTAYALSKTKNIRYPNPEQSNNFYGINSYVNYTANKNIVFDLSFGLQKSQVQKAYVDIGYTPFTTELSDTKHINLNAKIYGLNVQASHLDGYQNTLIIGGWEYNFRNSDVDLGYTFNLLNNKLNIQTGYNFRSTTYTDSLSRRANGQGTGFINNNNALLYTNAGYARLDFQVSEKLRLISSFRIDKYNYPDKMSTSYQFAGTYKPNNKNIIRVVVSKANKGPIILDNYFDYNWNNTYIYLNNKNLNLPTINLYELGYRTHLLKNTYFDLEVFHQIGSNFTISSLQDSVTPGPPPTGKTIYYSPQNLSLKPTQTGITLSVLYQPNPKLMIKPFGTWQKTVIPNMDKLINPNDSVRMNNDWTPQFYYGITLNYSASSLINFNANIYGFSQIYFHDRDYAITDVIQDKVLLNLKTSYILHKGISIYINVRNLNMVSLVSANRLKPSSDNQFGFTDNIKALVLFGLNVNL